MMSVRSATDYLYALPRGSKEVGLVRAATLLEELGRPQDAIATVHVAGTAGKGSVCAFVSSILVAHGFGVGTHLSPHVRSILERFQINGMPMAADRFVSTTCSVAAAVDAMADGPLGKPTFFEAANAIAFSRFAREKLDYAVIETGIGGLLDGTNTISRADKIAVVGRLGLDHTHLLGATVAEIARHKAGILPWGGHGIALLHDQASVNATVAATAATRGCTLETVDPTAIRCAVSPVGTTLALGDTDFTLGLQGRHQGVNAVLALRAVEYAAARDGWTLDPLAVRRGLATARLPGRFERHTVDGRAIILDGAHNQVKLGALVDTLRSMYPGRRAVWVLAARADKDLRSAMAIIAPLAERVIGTQFPLDCPGPTAPSAPAAHVAEFAAAAGVPAVAVRDPSAAVRAALDCGGTGPVVISGSFLHLAAADAVFTADTVDA